ncbi:MAG: heavy-metal-associated domain-containing protein [Vicinamibacterales bacterium]
MEQYVLNISGMSCGHCVARVSKALTAVPGVTAKDVQVGRAVIESTVTPVPQRAIASALEDAGFHLDAVSP